MLPELRLVDYLTLPIVELVKFPDFDVEVHSAALRLSKLTGKEIMQADMVDTRTTNGGNQ